MPNRTQNKRILQEKSSAPYQQLALKRFLWLKSNFAYCLLIAVVLWGAGICYYIEHFIGWGSVLALAPADFGIFVLTMVAPLFALWFILAYIERSSSLDANAQLFQMYINSLIYPDEEASDNAKAIASTLKEQITALQKENKDIIAQSAKLKADLDTRVTELSDILRLLDTYSAKTLVELNDGIKSLANRCTYITNKANNASARLKDCTEDITQNSDRFLSRISPVLDEISMLSTNIKGNITDNKTYLANMKEQLSACADLSQQHVLNMITKTDENAQKIQRSFYKTAEEYDALYKRLDSSISSIEGRIEEQKRLVHVQTEVINHNSDLINNKLSKYGRTVSEEIDKLVKNSENLEKLTKKQIATLRAVNSETGNAINGIGDIFDEKRMEIERRCEYAVNSMQNVVIAINKETEKLMSFTNLTQSKNNDLQNIAETIVDKISDISGKLALKTDNLKEKAVEIIDKFTQASDIIARSTDKITASSHQLVNDSKQGMKLLEEQNFYISNTLNNLDDIKEKLGQLKFNVSTFASELSSELSSYEKDIDNIVQNQKSTVRIEPPKPEFDRDKLINTAKSINRALRNMGINAEKFYEKQDMFDLWDNYIDGKQSVFTDILASKFTHKQTLAIRKAFDDNAEFHNQVIRYLFLMDMIIKELFNPSYPNHDELINFAVNMSLDKIYFILVRALNSAD